MSATVVQFVVPGEPHGKGRARISKVGAHARMFTPAKTAAYEKLVAWAGKQAMGSASPLNGPLWLSIEAVHGVPASWSKKRRQRALDGFECPTVKPDFDNIAKTIGDGGNGVVWTDDKQIVMAVIEKRYGPEPQVIVRVRELMPDGVA